MTLKQVLRHCTVTILQPVQPSLPGLMLNIYFTLHFNASAHALYLVQSWLRAGRCVVKFDHYCLLINTTVGDKNHARFLAYCVVEWFLIMWGWMLAWHALQPCYNLSNLGTAVRTANKLLRKPATVLPDICLCILSCKHDSYASCHANRQLCILFCKHGNISSWCHHW